MMILKTMYVPQKRTYSINSKTKSALFSEWVLEPQMRKFVP